MMFNRNDLDRVNGPQAKAIHVTDAPHMTTMGHALVAALVKADDVSAMAPVFVGRKLHFKQEARPGVTIGTDSKTTLLGARHLRRIGVVA